MADDKGSAYGAGAPRQDDAEYEKLLLDGRLEVAIGIRDRAKAAGNDDRYRRWSVVVDELLDRRLEVRGR